MLHLRLRTTLTALGMALLFSPVQSMAQEKFLLRATVDDYRDTSDHGYPPYPTASTGNVRTKAPVPANSKPKQLRPGILPSELLGTWSVVGTREKAEGGAPVYQKAMDQVMIKQNTQTWTVKGKPGSYTLSSSAGASAITVATGTTNTAFIRHEYPIGKCVAHESYNLKLDPAGSSFHGVMFCNVARDGEAKPRFAAEYLLTGQRILPNEK